MKQYLGIDIGGTKCAVILGNEDGKILQKQVFPTTTAEETLTQIFIALEELKGQAVAVGISCGGPLDETRGLILSPPNLPGWDAIPIVKLVQSRLGIPAKLCNDANACALAEWRFGAGKGSRNMIFLTFGTGLGAGLILDGRLYNGTNGNAGEVGHIRLNRFGPVGYGKQGSFEGFASGGGIAQLGKSYAVEALQQGYTPAYCKDIAALEKVTAKTIASAAMEGDVTALAVYNTVGEMLGHGLAILVDTLNPEKIIIGSVFQRAEMLLRPAMERVIREEALPAAASVVEVLPAALGDTIGDCAALALAIECGGMEC